MMSPRRQSVRRDVPTIFFLKENTQEAGRGQEMKAQGAPRRGTLWGTGRGWAPGEHGGHALRTPRSGRRVGGQQGRRRTRERAGQAATLGPLREEAQPWPGRP